MNFYDFSSTTPHYAYIIKMHILGQESGFDSRCDWYLVPRIQGTAPTVGDQMTQQASPLPDNTAQTMMLVESVAPSKENQPNSVDPWALANEVDAITIIDRIPTPRQWIPIPDPPFLSLDFPVFPSSDYRIYKYMTFGVQTTPAVNDLGPNLSPGNLLAEPLMLNYMPPEPTVGSFEQEFLAQEALRDIELRMWPEHVDGVNNTNGEVRGVLLNQSQAQPLLNHWPMSNAAKRQLTQHIIELVTILESNNAYHPDLNRTNIWVDGNMKPIVTDLSTIQMVCHVQETSYLNEGVQDLKEQSLVRVGILLWELWTGLDFFGLDIGAFDIPVPEKNFLNACIAAKYDGEKLRSGRPIKDLFEVYFNDRIKELGAELCQYPSPGGYEPFTSVEDGFFEGLEGLWPVHEL